MMITLARLLLLLARKIGHRIGGTGITVIGKIIKLILASFAIQSILTGVKDYFRI